MVTDSKTNNVACRIFKEQIDLINQLPEQERGIVLLSAINNAFNQFENQFDNQNENQNESAYISVSVSLSDISKYVLKLLNKNIVCREFSCNYGGKRSGSGRKVPKEDKGFETFVELVRTSFEKNVNTEGQKEIWMNENKGTLKQIYSFCEDDAELAIIAINKCVANLKRAKMNYSYRAVLRNIPIYYEQALEVRRAGKHIRFTKEQKEIISRGEIKL